jgi:hypothetical protein
MHVDEIIAECWAMFHHASATIDANEPGSFIQGSSLVQKTPVLKAPARKA